MKMKKVLAEKVKRGHEPLYSISSGATLREAAILMADKKIGALLVECDPGQGRFMGIVTERDIIECCAGSRDLDDVLVSEVMTRDMVTVDATDLVKPVVALMAREHIRHIPLTENSEIIALISVRDIMRASDLEKEITIAELSDYVGCTRRNVVY